MHDQTTLTINPNAKANDTVKVTRMRKQGSQSHAARGRNAWTTYCPTFKTHLDAFGTQTCHLFAPHSVMQLIFGIDIVCGYLISIVHGGTWWYYSISVYEFDPVHFELECWTKESLPSYCHSLL